MPNQQEDDAAAVDVDIERQAEDYTDVLRDDGNRNRTRKQRIFGWSRRPRRNSNATALRIQAIELLFGLPADHASKWPGILVFCHHLESCFGELLDSRFDVVWKILRRDSPSATVDCWHWCFAVIEAFKALQDDDPSIEKAYQRLIEDAEESLHEIKAHEKMQVLRAMFAVLCWTSATLKPLLDDEAMAATTNAANPGAAQKSSLAAENSSQIYSSRDLRRPISKMFYSFQNHAKDVEEPEHHPACGGTQSGGSISDDVLYQSSLNYFSLFTIGRVRLKWVDTLTAHLAFDRSTRTLSVFRFPSFCVANVLRGHDVKVLQKFVFGNIHLPFLPFVYSIPFPVSSKLASNPTVDIKLTLRLVYFSITAKLFPSYYYADSPQEPSALYREVLLSYRLLFGQSLSSHKLLDQLLSQSSSSTATANHHRSHSPSSSDAIIDDIDPFLPTICTSPLLSRWSYLSFTHRKKPSPLFPGTIFPSSVLDLNDQLQESDTYSARDDFTFFGPRLLTLQRYNMRQQPSKMKDLWRDRRNPLQWYTFWAVLWIGGATLVLGLLQLLVGIAQTYLAARPPRSGKR
ncbi:hypothetical protein GP486_005534 [Trichoglossum hirsutum]|uniref:Uncharacterized protein n=1 Tax=Trichoglossum hirsutum TaxID=265104 RepID=A0A9P8RMJ0_9PEZI|nr:hypothetical protein GP486_005534 [Trichoglossum hirsutum]